MRIVWSPLALERVRAIAQEVASERPIVAKRWVRAIFTRAQQLREYPQSGRITPDLGRTEVRQLPHPPYRIIYRVERSRILILTVRHGREAELDPTTEL
ncbi:MAG: type II toxin-antitoxin system RelE/ParE family toxin [Gemmatimonadaceae bacterium]